MKTLSTIALACVICASAASAHEYALKSLKIDHPFARATPPGAKTGGVFVTLENTGDRADRLMSVSSPVAGVAEIHAMKLDAGVMKMRDVGTLELKAGETVQLKPGGYHVMLSELRQPLKVGDRFPTDTQVRKRGRGRSIGVGRGAWDREARMGIDSSRDRRASLRAVARMPR